MSVFKTFESKCFRDKANAMILILISSTFAFSGQQTLENEAMKIIFDERKNGFNCVGIVNKLAWNTGYVTTGSSSAGTPGLWKIEFNRKTANGEYETAVLDNLSGEVKKTSSLQAFPEQQTLTMKWKGFSLPDSTQSVDVCVTVRLYSGSVPSNWEICVTNRSKNWSLANVNFPYLRGVVKSGNADVLWPSFPLGGILYKNNTNALIGNYPSWYCPMQFTAFNKGKAGLYIAAHDSKAGTKDLILTSNQDFYFSIPAENSTVPGNNWSPDYSIVIGTYKGDWWEAARLYKSWATQQKWCAKGLLANRQNAPKDFYDVDFWMQGEMKLDQWATQNHLDRAMENVQTFFKPATVGLHITGWSVYDFDTKYPEFFPTLDGVPDVFKKLRKENTVVMPYINAYLWDMSLPNFKTTGNKGAILNIDGEIEADPTPSGANSAYMCPFSEVWQSTIASICKRMVEDLNVNAIYLDQLACTRPKACYNPTHGHPLGGGHYWVDGYRAMLEKIRKDLPNCNIALTSEGCSEPYLDLLDGFLIGHGYRSGDDVPLLQAVYSGYTSFYGVLESRFDTVDTFMALQGRDFLWGTQLGWQLRFNVGDLGDKTINNDLLYKADCFNGTSPQFREIGGILKYFAQYRHLLHEFLTYGSLVGEVTFSDRIGTLEIERYPYFAKKAENPTKLVFPTIGSSVWLNAKKDAMAILLVNYSNKPITVSFKQDVKRWLGTGSYRYNTVNLGMPQQVESIHADGDEFRTELRMDARTVKVFVLRTSPVGTKVNAKRCVWSPLEGSLCKVRRNPQNGI